MHHMVKMQKGKTNNTWSVKKWEEFFVVDTEFLLFTDWCCFHYTMAEFMFQLEKDNTFSNLYFLIQTSLRTESD